MFNIYHAIVVVIVW